MKKSWICLCAAIVFLVSCGGSTENTKAAGRPALSNQHESTILAALSSKGYPAPKSIEINDSGWLVATFELANPRSAAYLEKFGTETLLAIRNAMQPNSIVSRYRVTLNGPSPGPDLILRYGNARFIEEGGRLEWEPAKR